MIERNYNIPFASALALREKQIQQNYRPLIAVHKWFARRPGTLFRNLLLSEFTDIPLADGFYRGHQLNSLHIADPFMGGGTPILEANRLGCSVVGYDINPMAWWIVREQIEHIDLAKYRDAATELRAALNNEIGSYYKTRCVIDGNPSVSVKYFLWVKVLTCTRCTKSFDLFPGYLLAENKRHPLNVIVCHKCGELNEVESVEGLGKCRTCEHVLKQKGNVLRGKATCTHCGQDHSLREVKQRPLEHRLFALEYHNPHCKIPHKGRYFKKPDSADLAIVEEVGNRLKSIRAKFIPEDAIPDGDESDRLHRWGYRYYRELFSNRQLLGLELSARLISKQKNVRIKQALATNLSDLLRYQNLLCRYDSMALKSLDIFSIHGFPVGLIQVESNLLGIEHATANSSVGSGGWSNIIDKYAKAKAFCDAPFEIRHSELKKVTVPIPQEWIGEYRNGAFPPQKREVQIRCQDASKATWKPESLDAVITDPPYFGNVQYAELMDFCYVWLRRLEGTNLPEFRASSTRSPDELTGNVTMGRGQEHFTEGMSAVFQKIATALKPRCPLAFTFHHNDLEAYLPLAVALLDSGMVCTKALPCPAEMGGSIHIHNSQSSIIDTVFVCRVHGTISKSSLIATPENAAALVLDDVNQLEQGGIKPTAGDIRCIAAGHIIRFAVWHNRKTWKIASIANRLDAVRKWTSSFGGLAPILKDVASLRAGVTSLRETSYSKLPKNDEISF
jgi:putative DNA methylase